jgi:hypothetical protein
MADTDPLPELLTLDEAYRAAFYIVLGWVRRGSQPDGDAVMLTQYLWTDPARQSDWQQAVRRALQDTDGLANPDHEEQWQVRPDMPT